MKKKTYAVVACTVALAAGCTSGGGATSSDVRSTTTSLATTTSQAAPTSTASTDASTTTSTPPAVSPLTSADLAALLAADMPTLTNSPGELMTVYLPDRGVDASAAAGLDDFGGAPLQADASFRIASVTKTFTSAAVYRLVESGAVQLGDSLVTAGVPSNLLDLLHGDGYDVDAITVAQVLNHSSGIFDYAFGEGSPYVAAVTADSTHVWTREEQVAFAMQHGAPVGAPGQVYSYSDTGYVILGALIEQLSGQSLGDAYASLLHFDALGMDHTYLEAPGSSPRSQRAHQYFGEQDATGWDASIDLYGGGGLVSTTRDLAVFFHALANGGVFDDPATFEAMTTVVGPDPSAAQGLFTDHVGTAACFSHSGFWGVSVITCPELGLTVANSWNQAAPEGWDGSAVPRAVVARLGIEAG